MIIKAETDNQSFRANNAEEVIIRPKMKAHIEVTVEELKFWKEEDPEVYSILMNILRKTSVEIARQAQVS